MALFTAARRCGGAGRPVDAVDVLLRVAQVDAPVNTK
jgi:hypothetical protein